MAPCIRDQTELEACEATVEFWNIMARGSPTMIPAYPWEAWGRHEQSLLIRRLRENGNEPVVLARAFASINGRRITINEILKKRVFCRLKDPDPGGRRGS